ncbi:hypothetical protein MTR62_01310 [Novosphingobium sp. 1949]|uniref:Transmembrane protein n=1 Tax=Novosphingobium organovorum TaxID=2930092 RepID=A0ABT0B982_9SPHN|nr:hypothetical protein [Novosphingobium organovorum]MCJ2181349.1 hypothetical protein [Novosphingobium organovorum]
MRVAIDNLTAGLPVALLVLTWGLMVNAFLAGPAMPFGLKLAIVLPCLALLLVEVFASAPPGDNTTATSTPLSRERLLAIAVLSTCLVLAWDGYLGAGRMDGISWIPLVAVVPAYHFHRMRRARQAL